MGETTRPTRTPKPSLRDPSFAFPLAGLVGLLAYDVARFGQRAVDVIRAPQSRDYGEGCVLALVQLLADRGNYFTSLRDYPYVHGNYPPVFPVLNLPGYLLVGPTLAVPRALSLVATLALGVLLGALVWRETRRRRLAVAFGALLLAPWFVQTWAPLGRVDMVACLLSVGGLYFLARAGPDGQRRWLGYACFWLAFFTKQNALLAPAAVVLGLALDRDTRPRAARVLAEISLPLLGLFGLLCLLTHGEAYRHLVPYTAAAAYEWDRMGRSYRDFFVLVGPLVGLVLPALAALRGELRGTTLTYVAYFFANLVALATISKAGAAQNYYIEPYIATLLLTGVLLDRVARPGTAAARALPAYLLVAAFVASVTDMERGRAILPRQDAVELAELSAIVRATNGPILSEDLSVLVLNRKPVLVEPFGVQLIARQGLLDPGPIAADCRAGKFALVIDDFRLREIAGMDTCLSERYESWKRLGPYDLLRPRPSPAPAQPETGG